MTHTKSVKNTMIIAYTFLVGTALMAQPDTTGTVRAVSTLPPLEVVIQAAIGSHPTVERDRASVRRNEAELAIVKKRWLDGLTFDAGAQWGAYGDRTLEKLMLGSRVGFSVRLSIWDILSQSDATEQYEAVVEESRRNVEISQRTIMREVVAAYNEALLSETLFAIAMREQVSAQMTTQTARKRFAEGEIDMSEYTRIASIESNAEEKVETYRSRWTTAVKVLEIIAGHEMEGLR